MHLYIITRGIKNWSDQFITELQGKYLPFKYPDKDGNLQPCSVQLAVRPIQLYELVFPEDSRDVVMASIFLDSPKTQHKKHEKFIWGIRKALGVEPIGEYKKDQKMPVNCQNVEVVGIGEKKDYWTHRVTHEHIQNPTEEQKKDCFEGL